MDFRNRNYYLIGKDFGYVNIPKELKRYFKCKMHCNIYVYDNYKYTHCVSIDKNNAKYLVNYLKDKNVHHVQIFEQFKRINHCTFEYVSEEEENRRAEIERLFSLFNYLEEDIKNTIDAASSQSIISIEESAKYIQDVLDRIYKIVLINPKTYIKFKNELEEIKKECFIEEILQSEYVDEDKILVIPKKRIVVG